eukprot:121719-Amphidinium_carterae.1
MEADEMSQPKLETNRATHKARICRRVSAGFMRGVDGVTEDMRVYLKDLRKIFQYKTLEDPFTKKTIDMPHDVESSSNTRHSMAKVSAHLNSGGMPHTLRRRALQCFDQAHLDEFTQCRLHSGMSMC